MYIHHKLVGCENRKELSWQMANTPKNPARLNFKYKQRIIQTFSRSVQEFLYRWFLITVFIGFETYSYSVIDTSFSSSINLVLWWVFVLFSLQVLFGALFSPASESLRSGFALVENFMDSLLLIFSASIAVCIFIHAFVRPLFENIYPFLRQWNIQVFKLNEAEWEPCIRLCRWGVTDL